MANITIEKELSGGNKFQTELMKILGFGLHDRTILVIRDFISAKYYARKNKVIYLTDNIELYEKFKNAVNNDLCGHDDDCILINNWKNKLQFNIYKMLEKFNMPKFDVVIMNPPYDKNLHLKIIDKIIPVADIVVNISPSTWAAKHNINQPKGKYREIFNNKIEEFIFIPHRQMNDIFGLGNAIEDGAIIVFKDGGKFDIMNYGFSSNIEKSLFMKIKTVGNKDLLSLRQTGVGTKKYNINDVICSPVYQWHTGKDCYDAVIKQKPKIMEDAIIFNSINEKQNFENSLKTTFMNWFHKAFIIPGDNKIVAYMFIMKDYTQPWTNERFCNFFNITGFIDDEHAEPNSEWEIILNTMKDFK